MYRGIAILLIINIVAFLLLKAAGWTCLLGGLGSAWIMDLVLFAGPDMILACPQALISYMFIHTDLLHFAVNMLWLALAGLLMHILVRRGVVRPCPAWLEIVAFLAGGLTAGLIFALCAQPPQCLVGASGAILGLVTMLCLRAIPRRLLRIGICSIALAAYYLIMCLPGIPVSVLVHISGAVGGVLVALIEAACPRPSLPVQDDDRQIIDRVRTSGYQSLSDDERTEIFHTSAGGRGKQ